MQLPDRKHAAEGAGEGRRDYSSVPIWAWCLLASTLGLAALGLTVLASLTAAWGCLAIVMIRRRSHEREP